jgi:hypothetical protein
MDQHYDMLYFNKNKIFPTQFPNILTLTSQNLDRMIFIDNIDH